MVAVRRSGAGRLRGRSRFFVDLLLLLLEPSLITGSLIWLPQHRKRCTPLRRRPRTRDCPPPRKSIIRLRRRSVCIQLPALHNLVQHRLDQRLVFAALETAGTSSAQRLLRFACGLHGTLRTSRAQGPVKPAMEKEQTRERERYTRTIASGPRQGR